MSCYLLYIARYCLPMTDIVEDPKFDIRDIRVMVSKWAVDCGRRVSDRRADLHLNGRALAAAAGCNEITIYKIENGSLNPRDHLKLSIAAALDVEVDMLWPFPKIAEVLALAGTAA